MKAAGRKNLSLVDTAYVDIESSSIFEGKWQRREEGEKSFGSGPSGIDLFEREEIRQMARANQYVTRTRNENWFWWWKWLLCLISWEWDLEGKTCCNHAYCITTKEKVTEFSRFQQGSDEVQVSHLVYESHWYNKAERGIGCVHS